ncbi:hypothetical protein TNCV_3156651 [Trichonephila clavipes]|nr:hypothetical protein TNCV_3156651 [Trichonephila clavipes]
MKTEDLSESVYEESDEKTDVINYIPVNPYRYVVRDGTEWILHNSNVPGRFATRNVSGQNSGLPSFKKSNVNISFFYDIKSNKIC